MYRLILVLAFMLLSNAVFACTFAHPQTQLGKKELVAYSNKIALVRPIHAERYEEYTNWSFELVKPIKGSFTDDLLTLKLSSATKGYVEVDFDRHESPEFWEGTYGRLPWYPGECAPRYEFELGGTYLLFLDALINGASAERIDGEGDRWFQFVLEEVSKQTTQ